MTEFLIHGLAIIAGCVAGALLLLLFYWLKGDL